MPALSSLPQLRRVVLHATIPGALGPQHAVGLPQVEDLTLERLSLALEGGGPALTALTALAAAGAGELKIAKSMPRLQQLSMHNVGRVQLAAPGLQLPALTSLGLGSARDSAELVFGAMPALRCLDVRIPDQPAAGQTCLLPIHGASGQSGLTELSLRGTPTIAPAVLASAAPSLRHLEIHLAAQVDFAGPLAAAVGSLCGLAALTSTSRAVLPLLLAEAPLRVLYLDCHGAELTPADIDKLGRFSGLSELTFRCAALEAELAQDEALLAVRPLGLDSWASRRMAPLYVILCRHSCSQPASQPDHAVQRTARSGGHA